MGTKPVESIERSTVSSYIPTNAGVVKLVDAPDSKSGVPKGRAGSTPASGKRKQLLGARSDK